MKRKNPDVTPKTSASWYDGKAAKSKRKPPRAGQGVGGEENKFFCFCSPPSGDSVRLYFEVRDLGDFCRKLQRKGFYITQLPRMMLWGWRHAYLNDADGHEISLYWAGKNRMKKPS